MSETQQSIVHTPGPWEVFGIIGKPGLMHVRACAGVDRVGRKQYQEVPISQADARLIAAAPEMLEALLMVQSQGSRGENDDGTSVSFYVEEAIRKATLDRGCLGQWDFVIVVSTYTGMEEHLHNALKNLELISVWYESFIDQKELDGRLDIAVLHKSS